MIQSIIVDDEPVAQRIIASYIEDIQDMVVLAFCKNAIEASNIFKSTTRRSDVFRY